MLDEARVLRGQLKKLKNLVTVRTVVNPFVLTNFITVKYEKLGEHGLCADDVKRFNADVLVEITRSKQVGRPDNGQILRRHTRFALKLGHVREVPGQESKRSPVRRR